MSILFSNLDIGNIKRYLSRQIWAYFSEMATEKSFITLKLDWFSAKEKEKTSFYSVLIKGLLLCTCVIWNFDVSTVSQGLALT